VADDAPILLARHYLEVERPQAALDALGRVPGDELDEPEYWVVRAHALLQLERSEESLDAARRGLAIDPEDIELMTVLVLAAGQEGLYDRAHEALDEAMELSPEEGFLHAGRALLHAAEGNVVGARKAIDEAMRLDPESEAVLYVRLQVALQFEDSATERYAEELLARYPEESLGHLARGVAAAQRNEFAAASRAFDEAARLDPSDPDLAEVAAEGRVAAHPVFTPLRPLWRFGRWQSWAVYFAIMSALAAAKLQSIRLALGLVWLSLIVLSYAGPRVFRWRERRKYGG
jgi:Flp pilus assembly protein TadD